MTTKNVFKILKGRLKSQIDETDPELIILQMDFITEQIGLQIDTGEQYAIESKMFTPSMLKGLIQKHLKDREPRKLMISFYYLEQARDYFTLFFTNGEFESFKLYNDEQS